MIELNKEYIVDIIGREHNGGGICRIDNFAVFVDKALENETVKIKITKLTKNYGEAIIIEIIKPSDNRMQPICLHFDNCGGCDLLNENYDSELSFKKHKVTELLEKIGGIKLSIDHIIKMDEPVYYRNKVVFHVHNRKIGFFEKKSNQIIEIEDCPLINPLIMKVTNDIRNNVALHHIKKIMVRATTSTNQVMIVFYGESVIFDQLVKANKNIKSIYLNDNIIYGSKYLEEEIGDFSFKISAKSFFQVNNTQMGKLYDIVKEYAGEGNTLLDLYCGTGTIGLYLADNYQQIIGIENIKSAINDANINKDINQVDNIDFILGDVSEMLDRKMNADTIVVDPPREGIEPIIIDKIIEINPKTIVYVSCNPATLARDLKSMIVNYDIKNITLVDMFPRTSHIECVVLLQNKIS